MPPFTWTLMYTCTYTYKYAGTHHKYIPTKILRGYQQLKQVRNSKIEAVIKDLSTRTRTSGFFVKTTKASKKTSQTLLWDKKERTLSNSLSKASCTQVDKNTTAKKKTTDLPLWWTETQKFTMRFLKTKFKNTLRRLYTMSKLVSFWK